MIKNLSLVRIIGLVTGVIVFVIALPLILGFISGLLYSNQSYSLAKTAYSTTSYIGLYDKSTNSYNAGNAGYMQQEYDYAINKYELAIEQTESADVKCASRFNWSEALLRKIEQQEDREVALSLALEALRVVSSKECLENDNYRHQFEVQIKIITKLIEELSRAEQESTQNNQSQDDQDDGQNPSQSKLEDFSSDQRSQSQYIDRKEYDNRPDPGDYDTIW